MATCWMCKHKFRTMEDEEGMHPCPRCGYDPNEEREREAETVPETDREKHLVEVGVAECVHQVNLEREPITMAEHREIGSDPGDFRDIGLGEAQEAMLAAGATGKEIGDLINAVCTDVRVEAALNEFYEELAKEDEK